MQLAQTSAHDVRLEIEKLRREREQDMVLGRPEVVKTESENAFLNEQDMKVNYLLSRFVLHEAEHTLQELRLYTSGLDSATKAARTIIAFLTHRRVCNGTWIRDVLPNMNSQVW